MKTVTIMLIDRNSSKTESCSFEVNKHMLKEVAEFRAECKYSKFYEEAFSDDTFTKAEKKLLEDAEIDVD